MIYKVTAKARPSYWDVVWRKKFPTTRTIYVEADNEDEAREVGRMMINYHDLCLATVDKVEAREDDKNSGADRHDINLNWDKPWWESNIVFYDTETTGLSPSGNRIVEIGFSRFSLEEKRFTTSDSYFINDGQRIPESASNIHGISNDLIEGSPTFEEIFPEIFEKHIKDTDLLGCQNRGFDHAFLMNSIVRSGLDRYYIPPVVCTMELGLDMKLDTKNNKLETYIEYFDIDGVNSHRAGDDAQGAGNVFVAMGRTEGSFLRRQDCTLRHVIHWFDNVKWPGEGY